MEYALFAGEQPSQLALATSGAARVAHAAGAEHRVSFGFKKLQSAPARMIERNTSHPTVSDEMG
jgi:hypothetical protein